MASLTICDIDEEIKIMLQSSAATKKISIEEEVRQILKYFLLKNKSKIEIGSRITKRFAEIGGIELALPARSMPRIADVISEDPKP